MKKFRIALLAVAIATAIGGAYASTQDFCESFPQYRLVGFSYVYAGEYGFNYYCEDLSGYCTYYQPNPGVPVYQPCRTGKYEPLFP